jgi:hypothetical protein
VVSSDGMGGGEAVPFCHQVQHVAHGKQQVVTVHPDGSVSGLQRKRGDGLDLRQLGRADIKRASHIVWCAEAQRWFIDVLDGPFAGCMITARMYENTLGERQASIARSTAHVGKWGELLFPDYEDAVAVEIEVLDGMRLRGWL